MSAGPAGLQLTYAPIGAEHLAQLKLLNSVLFPIKYQVGGTATPMLLQARPDHLKHVCGAGLSQDQLYKQCILFEHTRGGASAEPCPAPCLEVWQLGWCRPSQLSKLTTTCAFERAPAKSSCERQRSAAASSWAQSPVGSSARTAACAYTF